MNLFFTCVGFGFSRTLLDRGKKFCAGIALSVLLLVLLQGILGIAVAAYVAVNTNKWFYEKEVKGLNTWSL